MNRNEVAPNKTGYSFADCFTAELAATSSADGDSEPKLDRSRTPREYLLTPKAGLLRNGRLTFVALCCSTIFPRYRLAFIGCLVAASEHSATPSPEAFAKQLLFKFKTFLMALKDCEGILLEVDRGRGINEAGIGETTCSHQVVLPISA